MTDADDPQLRRRLASETIKMRPLDEEFDDGVASTTEAPPIAMADPLADDEPPLSITSAAQTVSDTVDLLLGPLDDDATPAAAASVDDDAPQNAADVGAEPAVAQIEAALPFVVEEWMYGALEALVFASAEPLSAGKAREVLASELAVMEGKEGMPLPTLADVKAAFGTLLERYRSPLRGIASGFQLVEIDGGLAFRTAASSARFIRRMQQGKPQRLSRAALETLAVVAYRQPATKPQIEEVRGVDCGGALKALLDKKLVRVLGKADEIGRPLLYGTTRTFLEFFHLAALDDLPTLKQLHELEHGPGVQPEPEVSTQAAVIMDLFNPDRVGLVSDETERESAEALDDLEAALTTAKDVAKKASTVVWGVEVEDDDAKNSSAATKDEPPSE